MSNCHFIINQSYPLCCLETILADPLTWTFWINRQSQKEYLLIYHWITCILQRSTTKRASAPFGNNRALLELSQACSASLSWAVMEVDRWRAFELWEEDDFAQIHFYNARQSHACGCQAGPSLKWRLVGTRLSQGESHSSPDVQVGQCLCHTVFVSDLRVTWALNSGVCVCVGLSEEKL